MITKVITNFLSDINILIACNLKELYISLKTFQIVQRIRYTFSLLTRFPGKKKGEKKERLFQIKRMHFQTYFAISNS